MTTQKNRFGLSRGTDKSLGKLITKEAPSRKASDIRDWRKAIESAEDVEYPDRTDLLDIYSDTMLDGLIISVTQRIIFRCTNSPITFSKNGEADDDHPVSKMIKTPLFLEIIEHIVASKWYGYSLVELDFKDGQIIEAELIPRKNVIPEKGLVVKNIGDTDGFNFHEPPHSNYLLKVGKKADLGLLNAATPYVIFKRAGMSSGAEYVERYGIPIQVYEYDPDNPNAKAEVEKAAREQGAAAFVIVPAGTKTGVHKGADGSGSAVFKDNKKLNDEEILFIFLLQTMTTKDGSSKSQAQVHQAGEDELVSAYKLFVERVLNYQLKPLLALHGMDVEGGEFSYADTERLSKMQLVTLLVELSKLGGVPLEYIEKHLGIKLTPKQEQKPEEEETDEEDKEKETEEEEIDEEEDDYFREEEKKKDDLSRYPESCQCAHEPLSITTLVLTAAEEDKLLKRIYEDRLNGEFDPTYFNKLAAGLVQQLDKDWPASKNIDYNSPDHLSKMLMELNLYRFSATKDVALIRKANELLRSSENFDQFKQAVTPLLENYNVHYLKTEYETARATGQSTANYLRNMEVAEEYPYWEYQTVGDDRVRPSHQALDGKLFLAGEVGTLNMPNGFNCRCTYVPRATKGGKTVLSEKEAIELLGEDYKQMKKAGFAVDRTANGYVFTEGQMYVEGFAETKLNFLSFGLEAYAKINKKAPVAKVTKRSKTQAESWFEERVGQHDLKDARNIRLLDYNGRPITLSKAKLLANKNWHVLDLVPKALNSPDEVYFMRKGKGYELTLIQYYQDKPLVVTITATNKEATISNWKLVNSTKLDKARQGLLIKSK